MAFIGWPTPHLGLDSIKRADALEDVGGQRRRDTLVQVEDLAPEVRPACDLGNTTPVEPVIAGIGVGLTETAKACEMGQGMCSGAVGCEAIPGRARRGAAGRPVVDRVPLRLPSNDAAHRRNLLGRLRPQPPGCRLAATGVEHRHRRVVGVDLVGLEHLVTDAADDGVEKRCGLPGPAGQRRAVDVERLRGHHPDLAVQRQMVVEFGNHDVRQRGEGGFAARNGAEPRGHLNDLLAHPATVFGADVAHDPPAHWHDIEHLMCIRTQRAQRTTAVRASAGTRDRLMDDFLARQMFGQAADGHRPNRHAGVDSLEHRRITLRLQFLQRQFELFDLTTQLLGRGAELHPPQPRDLFAQRINEQVASSQCGIGPGERGLQRGNPRGGVSRGNERFRHPDSIADRLSTGEQKRRETAVPTPPAWA